MEDRFLLIYLGDDNNMYARLLEKERISDPIESEDYKELFSCKKREILSETNMLVHRVKPGTGSFVNVPKEVDRQFWDFESAELPWSTNINTLCKTLQHISKYFIIIDIFYNFIKLEMDLLQRPN